MDNSQPQLNTVRVQLPDNVKSVRVMPGGDLLFTTHDVHLIDKLKQVGFEIVEREFKLHVSCKDIKTFEAIFKDVKYESRQNSDKFIATVVLDNKEQYDNYLKLGNDPSNECRIKPYKQRFTMGHSDASQNLTSQYQRNPQKGYDNENSGNGGKGGKGKGGKGGKGKGGKGY